MGSRIGDGDSALGLSDAAAGWLEPLPRDDMLRAAAHCIAHTDSRDEAREILAMLVGPMSPATPYWKRYTAR